MSMSHRCYETFTSCGLWTHQFQPGCAHLPMPTWSGTSISFRLDPARRRFQPPPSPVASTSQLVIRRTRLSTVGDCAFPVTGSRIWNCLSPDSPQLQRWLFPEPHQNISFPDYFLPNCFRFPVLYTVYSSGLAVLYLNHCNNSNVM